ncbi:hypothetical protein BHE74_00035172 [Ensete ventricosum]|nr:hypothetical protein GW17_00017269 [Ensete ventricosum]RWW58007.1 hypothetical protein BHE74_00035172 [Ensete ventricosum]
MVCLIERYVPIRQLTGMRTAHYRAVLPAICPLRTVRYPVPYRTEQSSVCRLQCAELDKKPEEPEIDPINLQFYNKDSELMLE